MGHICAVVIGFKVRLRLSDSIRRTAAVNALGCRFGEVGVSAVATVRQSRRYLVVKEVTDTVVRALAWIIFLSLGNLITHKQSARICLQSESQIFHLY